MTVRARGNFVLRFRRLLGAGFLLAIGFAALLPEPWKGRLSTTGPVHFTVHVVAFLVAYLLIAPMPGGGRWLLLTGLLLFVFGAVLEVLQTRVFGNELEIFDMVANGVGLGLGFAGVYFVSREGGVR